MLTPETNPFALDGFTAVGMGLPDIGVAIDLAIGLVVDFTPTEVAALFGRFCGTAAFELSGVGERILALSADVGILYELGIELLLVLLLARLLKAAIAAACEAVEFSDILLMLIRMPVHFSGCFLLCFDKDVQGSIPSFRFETSRTILTDQKRKMSRRLLQSFFVECCTLSSRSCKKAVSELAYF